MLMICHGSRAGRDLLEHVGREAGARRRLLGIDTGETAEIVTSSDI
jgi:hypothetical protein